MYHVRNSSDVWCLYAAVVFIQISYVTLWYVSCEGFIHTFTVLHLLVNYYCQFNWRLLFCVVITVAHGSHHGAIQSGCSCREIVATNFTTKPLFTCFAERFRWHIFYYILSYFFAFKCVYIVPLACAHACMCRVLLGVEVNCISWHLTCWRAYFRVSCVGVMLVKLL